VAKELASLPSAYGFESLKEFVAAITDAVRAEVKALVKAGKTGSHCLWEASHKQCYDAQRIMLT